MAAERLPARAVGTWAVAMLLPTVLAGPAAAQSGGTADAPRATATPAPSALVGRLVDAATGQVVEGAAVRLDGAPAAGAGGSDVPGDGARGSAPAGASSRGAISGPDGRFRIAGVPAGAYTLRVEHIAYAPAERALELPRPGVLEVALTVRPLSLDELVVTAGRRVQRLGDAAVATELVTRREIRETGATDLASVLTERTGVELEGGHPVGAGVMIQGMGSERVLVLLDGQPFVGRIAGKVDVSRIPTSMIERVEVVKGPQSTLYGSEAMGGVVNVVTRSPEGAAWSTTATVTAGDRGRLDVSGGAMGGVGDVRALLDVGRRTVDLAPGWAAGSGAGASRWDGLARARWSTPVEGLAVEASGLLLDERQSWTSGQLHHFADNTQWSARLGAELSRGPHRLAPTVHASAFDHLSRRATGPEPVEGTGESETQRLAEAELLYGLALGEHALDAGVEARRESVRSDRVEGGRRDSRMVETFVQGTVDLGRLTLVPGLRVSASDPWGTHWTPRVAAMLRPVPELAVRVSAGEGFRAPSFKELHMEFLNVGPGFGYTVRGNPDLMPEVSRNVTASVEWAGERAYVRVQAFHNRFDDFIETRVVGDSSGITVHTYGNVDDGVTRGGEVEVGATWKGWRAEGGWSVLEAEHAGTGEPLLGRPQSSLRGMLGWAHPVGLRISLTGVRTGRTPMDRVDDGGTAWREAFLRFDARAAMELPGGLELVAGADNLTDARPADWPGFAGRHLYTSLSWRVAGGSPAAGGGLD